MLLKVRQPVSAEGLACALVAAASQANAQLQLIHDGGAAGLEVDGRLLTDAFAICRHLASLSGASSLLPAALPQSATHDSLLDIARAGSYSSPLPQQALEGLEKQLEQNGPFLLGISVYFLVAAITGLILSEPHRS